MTRSEFPLFPFSRFRPFVVFLENTSPRTRDPWANRELWRYDSFFSVARRTKAIFPGLGLAAVVFAGYLGYERWFYTLGPGKEEVEYWQKWTEERNERLAKEGHGHHH